MRGPSCNRRLESGAVEPAPRTRIRETLTIAAAVGAVFLLAAGPAPAGDGVPFMVNGGVTADAAGGTDVHAGAVVQTAEATWLDLSAAHTTSPANRADLVTHTVTAGISHNVTANTGFALNYENWGDPGDVTSNSVYGSLFSGTGSWSLALLPQWRRITLYTRNVPPQFLNLIPGSVDVTDRSLGLRLQYLGVRDWLFEVSATRHHYSRDPSILNARRALLLFNASTLTLAHGFQDHSESVRVERDFGLKSIALDYEQDTSAVDGSLARTIDIEFITPISTRFDLTVRGGSTHLASVGNTGFATVNLTYYH